MVNYNIRGGWYSFKRNHKPIMNDHLEKGKYYDPMLGKGWPDRADIKHVSPSRKTRKNSKKVHRHRLRLWRIQNYCCYYCHQVIDEKDLTLDHKIPRCKGGRYNNNVVVACYECNMFKGSMGEHQFIVNMDRSY